MKNSRKQKTFTKEDIDAIIYTARHMAKSANERQTIELLAKKDPAFTVEALEKLTQDVNGLLDGAYDLIASLIDEQLEQKD